MKWINRKEITLVLSIRGRVRNGGNLESLPKKITLLKLNCLMWHVNRFFNIFKRKFKILCKLPFWGTTFQLACKLSVFTLCF